MKYVVTGGAGCIGNALISFLQKLGHEIRIIDLPEKITAMKELGVDYSGIDVRAGSILDRSFLLSAMRRADVVVHLAAHLGVNRTEADPLSCLNVNIYGSQNVFEAAIAVGARLVVNASSSEVYGAPEAKVVSETTSTQGYSVYAVSKLASEEILKATIQSAASGVKGLNLRFFNSYGPYQVGQFVIPKFISDAMNGRRLIVNGDGSQIRSYTYSSDIARGLCELVEYYLRLEASGITDVINLGSSTNTKTVIELAELICDAANVSRNLIQVDEAFMNGDRSEGREIFYRLGDFSKVESLVDFKALTSVEEGVASLIRHFVDIPKWGN